MLRRTLPLAFVFVALALSTLALDTVERERALFAIACFAGFVCLVFWEPLFRVEGRPAGERSVPARGETDRYGIVEGELVRVLGPHSGGVLVERPDGRQHTIPARWIQPITVEDLRRLGA